MFKQNSYCYEVHKKERIRSTKSYSVLAMTKTIHNNIRTDKVAKISFLSSFLQDERSASALRTFASLLQLLRQHDRTW